MAKAALGALQGTAVALVAALLAGCAVGPDFVPPAAPDTPVHVLTTRPFMSMTMTPSVSGVMKTV